LFAPLPRSAVAGRRAQQRHRAARRRARSGDARPLPRSARRKRPGIANKLKFFRLAFGAAGGFGDEVDTREARVAIEGLFGGDGRIQLGWMVDEPTMSKPALKVLMNLVLIAGDALVRGGRLDVGAERHSGGLEMVVRAEGPRIVLDPELKRALLGESSEEAIAPRAAAAWLVHCLLSDGGGEVQVADGEAGVLLIGAALPVL
jgi:histidine phosphotransferase ChpT